MDNTLVRELVDAGIHFGHRVGRWNPKMKPYIYCSRNSIHIIDIKETMKGLLRARKFLSSVVASGQDVLFVGTKRQARKPLVDQATRCGMPYVTERWLGGTLTNFRTIRSRLGRLEELEQMEENGQLAAESKKRQSTLRREMRKIKRNLDGIRNMEKMPGVLVLIDARREHIALLEARILKIPTICLMDTDSDPDMVDLPIPGNDDAMRVIEIITQQLADAVLEGKSGQGKGDQEGDDARRGRSRRMSTARAAQVIAGDTSQIETDTQVAPEPLADPTPAAENQPTEQPRIEASNEIKNTDQPE
ncbi:MAG: 30S ribosomal protein S2 [Planctomycetes bacterium]|nr:30S ribosomal protein S2 [Planctomycetota bacterium]